VKGIFIDDTSSAASLVINKPVVVAPKFELVPEKPKSPEKH